MELRRWIQVICILPALQDFLVFRVYSMQCPNTHYLIKPEGELERCCIKCDAGERVKTHCSKEERNSTDCVGCDKGYYQPASNGETSCRGCEKQYKANRKILKSCTKLYNMEYGDCYEGFYYNTVLDTCSKCSSCPVGYGVTKECTTMSNTECEEEKCGIGTYSDQESLTQKCTHCTACKNDEEMHKECTPSSNYECRPKITTSPTKDLLITSITSTSSTSLPVNGPSNASREEGRSWVMPFFIASMVLLLILFVAFVIGVTIWCHIHSRNRHQSIIVEAEDFQAMQRLTKMVDDVESVCLPNESRNVYHAIPESKPGGILENGMMIRDVSHDTIEELANFLNPTSPPSNWRKVASVLDFQWNVINNLALSPTTATQQLLERWGTKRDATVHKLYQTLKDIGRDDAAEVIERLLVRPVPSCPKSV